MSTKKRVLIPIVGQGSIQHIIRTGILKGMQQFCVPVVAMAWQQDDLINELKNDGFEVYIMPPYKMDANYESIKSKINHWYLNFSLKTPGFELEKKFRQTYSSSTTSRLARLHKFYLTNLIRFNKAIVKKWKAIEEAMMKESDVYRQYAKWLTDLKIDSIFTVTPFLSEVNLVGRILKERGNKIIASIHSFDNVTKRSWQQTVFDCYLVWNRYNQQELLRVYGNQLAENDIKVIGAPQFDFHFNSYFLLQKEEWLSKFGIPANKKIILYAGGAGAFFPMEVQYAIYIKQLIESGDLQNTVLLVRHHPLDKPERWLKHIGQSGHVFFETPQQGTQKLDYANVTVKDIQGLMSTLAYTDVHISFCSTITVDGSAFGKPQIGVYYDESQPADQQVLRNIYKQEHYLPIINNNGISLAKDREQLKRLLTDALEHPENYTTQTGNCLREIITYNDGKSAERALQNLKIFFS